MFLDHVSIKVLDLEGMKDFYLKYFCRAIRHEFINPYGLCYGYILDFIGRGSIELLLNRELRVPESPDGNYHFCLTVADLRGLLSKVPDEFVFTPFKFGKTDGVPQVMFMDPEKNLIEIHETIFQSRRLK